MMISNVKGNFGKFTANVQFDEQKPTSLAVEATVDVSSINTGIDKRDEHLKSADFFDVAKYPSITFKSTKVESAGTGKYRVYGDFTMHGVTKSIVLDGEGFSPILRNPWGKMVTGRQCYCHDQSQRFRSVLESSY